MRYFLPLLLAGPAAHALQVAGHTAAVNDRFSSGYANAPVPNSSGSFLGAGLDLSGTGWQAGNPRASVALLSPRHAVGADHFLPANGTAFIWADATGVLRSATQQSKENTGYGPVVANNMPDISLVTWATALPSASVARYAVLDLQVSSTADATTGFSNLPLLIYGHGGWTSLQSPRLGNATLSAFSTAYDFYATSANPSALEGNDSGSPTWHKWQNPNGAYELALTGIHAGVDSLTPTTINYDSFLSLSKVMTSFNTLMNDEGRALRCVGNTSATWQGSSTNQNLSRASFFGTNWSVSSFPDDKYVLFNPASTTYRSPVANTELNLRGLYFKSSSATGDGFTFGGTFPLTIGRGGITNYDNNTQTFNAPVTLGAPQYWSGGPGGLSLGSLNTNGNLVEIRAGGGVIISGNISGSGAIALESGNLTLSGTSSLTGKVWVHEGLLELNGSLSTVSSVDLAANATLCGSGAASVVSGAGKISQAASRQILTAQSLQPAAGLDLDLTFTAAGSPTYGSTTSCANDVLRLKAAAPLATAFTAANVIRVFLDAGDLKAGAVFRGGLYFDTAPTWSSLSAASWQIYVADPTGSVVSNGKTYSLYSAPGAVSLDLAAESAAFAAGTANGSVLRVTVPPDPRTYSGWAAATFPTGTATAEMLPDADPNHDGVPNLLAYLLDLSPVLPSSTGLPSTTLSGGSLVYQFRQSIAPADATLTVQTSTTLASDSWSTLAVTPEVVNADVDGDGKTRLMRVVVPVSAQTPRCFLRLRAATNP